MVDPQTTLGEQLLDLAIGERKAQVPADREQDHLRLKLAPLEQSGNRWGEEHRPSLSGQTSKLATLPAKVLTVAKQSSQYRILVQIELEKYLGSFHTLRFGEKKPFTGSCHNGQLDLFYYRDPGLKAGKSFPLWTIM